MKTRNFTPLFALFLVLSASTLPLAAQAAPPPQDHVVFFNKFEGRAFAPMANSESAVSAIQSALRLTEAQTNALRTLLNMRAESTRSLFQDLQQKHQNLQAVLSQENPTAIDIGNAHLAVKAAERQLRTGNERFQTDFTALLSAEQRQSLESIRNAAAQIDALRQLGLANLGPDTFNVPVPPMGLPMGGQRIGR